MMKKNFPLRVLLADDQASVRAALRLLLEQQPGIVIVAEASNAGSLLTTAAAYQADVVLLDWELPGLIASQMIRLLKEKRPSLQIIAMSTRPEARRQSLKAGAAAFLSKSAPPETVLTTLAPLPKASA